MHHIIFSAYFLNRTLSDCAGICNAFRGNLAYEITLYSRFCGVTSPKWHVGTYAGLPAIISTTCTGVGVHNGKDGGKICSNCKDLRVARGNSNPCQAIKLWGKRLSECLERRERVTFANSDLNDAQAFARIKDAYLGPEGIQLKTEAKCQIEYASHMAKLDKCLKEKSHPTVGEKSVPGIRTLFNEAAVLCEKNPEFQSSLIVALFKAAVCKEKFGTNAKTEESVVNFYRFIATFDAKAASVVSANLRGPSMRWMKELNARERKECMLACGKNNEKVVERMVAAIERRKSMGASGTFSLAIDATKLSPLLETSLAHAAIVGAEHPNELIDAKGLTKDQVKEILSGKSKKYGKLEPASEVKASNMSYCMLDTLEINNKCNC